MLRAPGRTGSTLAAVLRYLTAGESHGAGLVVIVEGLPAGLPILVEEVQGELARRLLNHGNTSALQAPLSGRFGFQLTF